MSTLTSNSKALLEEIARWIRTVRDDVFEHGNICGRTQRSGEDLLRRIDTVVMDSGSHETKACVWEDCDQEAIYCAGHAREFVRGEPVKAADPKMVPCTACGNKPIDAQHCDVCYPPGACEWCATGIPRSTDGRRHESDMGVWACRAPAKKANSGDSFPETSDGN